MTGRSRKVPTEAEVLRWFDTLSNWGRWGPDDELGTLNLITPAKRLEAVRLVRKGIAVSCARPIEKGVATDVPHPPLHFMMSTGETWVGKHSREPAQMALDFMGLVFHGFTVTHLDCLCHFFWKGKMYNGRRADVVTASSGASVCSAETVRDGIVKRGVLLDVAKAKGKKWLEAGEAVFPEDLEMAERQAGVRVTEGDALLVRLGWYRRRKEVGPPGDGAERSGLHAATLPWLRERGVSLIVADASHDVVPGEYKTLFRPVHQIGIVAMGLWLLDAANLEELAQHCGRLKRWEFLFTVAPLRFPGATGSPVNPLAVF